MAENTRVDALSGARSARERQPKAEGVPSYAGLQGHGIPEEYQPKILDPTKLP